MSSLRGGGDAEGGEGGGGGGKEQSREGKQQDSVFSHLPDKRAVRTLGWETVAHGLVTPSDKAASPDTSICQTGIITAGHARDNMGTLLFFVTHGTVRV